MAGVWKNYEKLLFIPIFAAISTLFLANVNWQAKEVRVMMLKLYFGLEDVIIKTISVCRYEAIRKIERQKWAHMTR